MTGTSIISRARGASRSLLALLVLAAGLLCAPSALAAPPPNFQTSLILGDGLNGPSGFDIAPDGRIFVLERSGLIKIVKNGQLLPTPFADLPSEATGDRGLIGIAFDPDFGVSNHYVYFYYTGHDLLNHLVRFDASGEVQLSPDNGDVATTAGSKTGRRISNGPLPGELAGALAGRIGNGRVFAIGNQTGPLTMPDAGLLYLAVNDDNVDDNRGAFNVTVNAMPGTDAPTDRSRPGDPRRRRP